jgi:hypothetical protein
MGNPRRFSSRTMSEKQVKKKRVLLPKPKEYRTYRVKSYPKLEVMDHYWNHAFIFMVYFNLHSIRYI